MGALKRDATLALRHARRAPGFTAIAVLTLALGIGLTTVVFTLVDQVLLRPLAFPSPNELYALWSVTEGGSPFPQVSSTNWQDWREQNRTLAATGLYRQGAWSVGSADGAMRVPGAEVGGEFFAALQAPMLVGRAFREEEAQREELVAVVSEGFWRARMGARRDLPVETLVNGRSFQVVGVVPRGFEFPSGVEVWLPHAYERRTAGSRNNINFEAIARLAPDVTRARAKSDLDRVAAEIRAAAPDALYSWGVGVIPLREAITGDVANQLRLLLGAVAFVLLVACVNVAGLSLARTLARRGELTVCIALGSGRARLVRQLVTEHLLIGLAGGAAGVLLAWAGTRLLATRAGELIPRAETIAVDGRILVFGLVASILAGVLAGLIPALKATQVSLAAALGGTRGAARESHRLGPFLVAAEVALALLLLSGSGLLLRSFGSLVSRDLGFDAGGIVTADAALITPRYSGAEGDALRRRYWDEQLERMRRIPGTAGVALANWIPTSDGGRGFIEVPGFTGDNVGAGFRAISDDYFDVLGMPLLRGRTFDATDDRGAPPVAVINQAMAEMYWPGENPLGRTVLATSMEPPRGGTSTPERTIVGVVGDIRHYGFEDEADPEMYVPFHQTLPVWMTQMTAIVRAGAAPVNDVLVHVQRIGRELDPQVAVEVATLDARLDDLVHTRRFVMTIVTGFGALALFLAAIGLYGLLAFTVAERTREIGIRAALGARRSGIIGMMLGRAMRVVAAGTLAGVLAALWLNRLLSSMLVDIEVTDPLTYTSAIVVLGAVATIAAFLPAWRAARVDPLIALRSS